MARCVLPVLVGPSTAVTPAPGARSLENAAWEGEKAMSWDIYVLARLFVIARSEMTEQSTPLLWRNGLLRFARNDG